MSCGARRCGYTGTTPDCVQCQGNWSIQYIVPSAPKVRYRVGDTPWGEIIGATYYTIDPITSNGTVSSRRYNLFVDSIFENGAIIKNSWGMSNVSGPVSNISLVAIANDPRRAGRKYFQLSCTDGIGQNRTVSSSYSMVDAKLNILDVITGANVPPSTSYRLRIYNCRNEVKVDLSHSTQPEAQFIPPAYDGSNSDSFVLKPESYRFPKPYKAGLIVTPSQAADGRKGAKVLAMAVPVTPESEGWIKQYLNIYSPDCCDLPPKICWTCQKGKECPPNTCEIECHGRICCYNSQGIPVFSYEE